MNNKIYIFGGYNGESCELESVAFDLRIREWKTIHALPKASDYMTAAVLNKYIILSGCNLNCCYSYDDSAYKNILSLPESCVKVVCDRWILADSVLYEYQKGYSLNWIRHNIYGSHTDSLLTFSVFKKNQYFYFITHDNSLMRIDTMAKTLERMKFS